MSLDTKIPVPRNRIPPTDTRLVIILATPSFAHIFDQDNDGFIRGYIPRIFEETGSSNKCHVLGAVVDQISLPSMADTTQVSVNHPYLYGMEGLSFLVTTPGAVGINLWGSTYDEDSLSRKKSFANAGGRISPLLSSEKNNESRPSLSFVIRTNDDLSKRIRGQHVAPLIRRTIELPLANTTFRNGRSFTLTAQLWEFRKGSDGEVEAKKLREREMTQARVNLQLDERQIDLEPNFKGWLPLTKPRAVAKSAGNVIRTFKSSVGLLGEIPASEELEVAVADQVIKPYEDPPEIREVWAQVTPRERWSSLPSNLSLDRSLDRGDRFFKVVSGGGGWGGKRGLIALEPDGRFEAESRESRSEENPFPELVRQGDVVRFIGRWCRQAPNVALHRAQPLSVKKHDFVQKWVHTKGGTSLRFGATSPLGDEAAASSKMEEGFKEFQHLHPNFTHEFQFMAAYGHFGALADQSVNLSAELYTPADDRSVGSQPLGTIVSTTLPPFVDLNYTEAPMRAFGGRQRRNYFLGHVAPTGPPKRVSTARKDRETIANHSRGEQRQREPTETNASDDGLDEFVEGVSEGAATREQQRKEIAKFRGKTPDDNKAEEDEQTQHTTKKVPRHR